MPVVFLSLLAATDGPTLSLHRHYSSCRCFQLLLRCFEAGFSAAATIDPNALVVPSHP